MTPELQEVMTPRIEAATRAWIDRAKSKVADKKAKQVELHRNHTAIWGMYTIRPALMSDIGLMMRLCRLADPEYNYERSSFERHIRCNNALLEQGAGVFVVTLDERAYYGLEHMIGTASITMNKADKSLRFCNMRVVHPYEAAYIEKTLVKFHLNRAFCKNSSAIVETFVDDTNHAKEALCLSAGFRHVCTETTEYKNSDNKPVKLKYLTVDAESYFDSSLECDSVIGDNALPPYMVNLIETYGWATSKSGDVK